MSTKRYSAAEWRVLVEEAVVRSGKSKAEFARSRGVSAATLSWRSGRADGDGGAGPGAGTRWRRRSAATVEWNRACLVAECRQERVVTGVCADTGSH
jgi:hypothetical protein